MAEMIVPGTYIDVRAEGLISAGRIATGVVGVVGTAASGPLNQAVTLAGIAQAREMFGAPDDYAQPEDGSHPLTLTRALQYVYGNGASGVIAVRIAGSSAASATLTLKAAGGDTVVTLAAASPGAWANDMLAVVADATSDLRVQGETLATAFTRLKYTPVVPSPENQIRLVRGASKVTRILKVVTTSIVKDEVVAPTAAGRFMLSATPVVGVATTNAVRVVDKSSGAVIRIYRDPNILYGAGGAPAVNEIRIPLDTGEITFEASQKPNAGQQVIATYAVGHAAPQTGEVLVTVWDGTLSFATGEAPVAADGDRLVCNYVVDRSGNVEVSLTSGTTVERYTVPDGVLLAQLLNARSALATATASAANGGKKPDAGFTGYFGTGANTAGNNGADASPDDYAAGLETLANLTVNIVHLAGQDALSSGDTLTNHLNATADVDHERIGVIGAPGASVATFKSASVSSDRVVLVAPGLKLPNGQTLPPAYAAAAVAGCISSVAAHVSLTNKAISVPGLALTLNRGEQEQLIGRNVLTLVDKEGFRILKGVTTQGEGHAVLVDSDPPDRGLREVRRPVGCQLLHRPAQQQPCAGRAESHARRLPHAHGRR